MDPKQKKKIENFKKEIKRQVFEKKKIELRKQLPYYKEMFKQNDQSSSDASNSRSSRFPIKSGSSKQKSSTFVQSKAQKQNSQHSAHYLFQKHLQYLQYLKNLNSTFSEQDKVLVQRSMTSRLGERCFQNIEEARAKICFDLLTYQANIHEKQSQLIAHEKFTFEDWKFVIASFKIGENEKFEQISKRSFILITSLFNQWYLDMLKKSIDKNRGRSIEGFFDTMKQLSQTQIAVQEIILSRIMESCEGQIDTQIYLMITKYFLDRINLFELIEKTLVKYYEAQETQNFAQLIYNFGFLHAMEILAYMSQNHKIDTDLRISMFNVVNRYFSMYPFEVQSETQTQEKFNQFITFYLNNLICFFKELQHQNRPNISINFDDPLYQFLRSSMILINSLIWRETSQNFNYQIYQTYFHLINFCLTTDGLLVRVQQFKDLHKRMVDFSLSFSALIQNGTILFKQDSYLSYINLLTLYFHEFKLKSRSNLQKFLKPSISMSQVQQLLVLQTFLIYAIYVINNISLYGQEGKVNQNVQRLLQYTEFVYRKQHHALSIRSFQIRQNFYLIFNSNVRLYFRLIINPAKLQISNPQNEQNQSQHSQQIDI